MEKTEKNQEKLMFKFSMIQQQAEQIQQQLQVVEQNMAEISRINLGLDALIGGKGKEIMAKIGNGIYAKAKLIEEELIVDIGNQNLVKKSIPETKEIIGEQIKKLEEVQKELYAGLDNLNKEIMGLMVQAENGTKI